MNKCCSIAILVICLSACGVNPAERNNAGNTLSEQGQYESAIAAYQAAQVASSDSPEAYYNAASAYSQAGEYDKAIAALQQALKTTDGDLKTRAYFNLGNVYFQLQQFDGAVEAYQQVLLINPSDDDARHNLELAIKRLVVPSPTPISPTDQPTEEGGIGATPTPEAPNQPTAVASSTADVSNSQPNGLTSTPATNNLPATISVDDAESILDAVQQAEQPLPNQTAQAAPPPANSGKDW